MVLDPQKISTRDKLILTGLFLSKYNSVGLSRLGFETFKEAFNVIGYGLGQKPASIKNYRDEFDPLLSSTRRGWHKRPRREYCLKILNDYQDLDIATFTSLIQSFVGYDENLVSNLRQSRRLVKGGAAQSRLPFRTRIPAFIGDRLFSLFHCLPLWSFDALAHIMLVVIPRLRFVAHTNLWSPQASRQGRMKPAPFPTLPELSNSGSHSSRAGGFMFD
jgi:hypothetical protein